MNNLQLTVRPKKSFTKFFMQYKERELLEGEINHLLLPCCVSYSPLVTIPVSIDLQVYGVYLLCTIPSSPSHLTTHVMSYKTL